MSTRRPLVIVSGLTSELPPGDSVIGVAAGILTAGSGLSGGGDVSTNTRLDLELAANPSGLIFVLSGDSARLGLDGSAQASGNASLGVGATALASGNAALSLGSTANSTATSALASGNAALVNAATALASGNSALVVGSAALRRSGDTATGQIVFVSGTAAAPGIGVGDTDTGFYRPAPNEVGIACNGVGVFKIDASGLASFLGESGLDLPQGTTAQRPTGNIGITRYNTQASGVEIYTSNDPNWQDVATLQRVQSFTKAQRGTVSGVGLASGTVTLQFAEGNNFSITLGGTTIFNNPTDLQPGQAGVIFINQDSVGSRTASFSGAWDFPEGTAPTLTTTVSGVDVLAYAVRSTTNIAARVITNFS